MISESLGAVLLSRQASLGRLIYQGTNVAVYEGLYSGYPAAIKVLYLNVNQDMSQTEREFRSLSSLQHPNVLRIYDYIWHCENSCICLVLITELCMKDFDHEIKERKASGWYWTEAELWGFLKTITAVLAYMQRQGVAHRDIKPANVFLAYDGTIKLGDFGSSKFMAESQNTTLAGTPFFLSPKLKQALMNGWVVAEHNVFKSDVYSLGIVLLMMAKLDPPMNSVFSLNPSESFSTEINSLRYSDRLKGVLQVMLAWEENDRSDFGQLEQWLQQIDSYSAEGQYSAPTAALFVPIPVVEANAAPIETEKDTENLQMQATTSEQGMFAPDACAICKKPSDMKQSRQLFVGVSDGQRFMCCSKECEDLMKTIKAKRKEFDCPICKAPLPANMCEEIATFLANLHEYSNTETCPTCHEDFEVDKVTES